ncbi:MAG: hypothetical protein KOO63_13750 [Bacteroidales bacterium]|nr:hypothetical protein [Candidatus Latescibacterota bacterium]
MENKYDKEIKKIMMNIDCPKDFRCYKQDFKDICKAKDFGIESYVDCGEDDSPSCLFAFDLGDLTLCKCTLRVFVSKKMKI